MIQKFVSLTFILSIFVAVEGSFSRCQPLFYMQTPACTQTFQKKNVSFLQIYMKKTMFVKTIASPITTTTCVFYPLVKIVLDYLDKLRSWYANWIQFVSPINKWPVFIPCSGTGSTEKKYFKGWKCVSQCAESNLFYPKKQRSGQNAEYRKKEGLEKNVWAAIYECSPKE